MNKKTSDLIPYEFNNKIHNDEQVNHIANSIKEFGFLQPIVIDGSNVIVAGHGRREASKKLGLEEVPVILADDLTDVQIKKYRLLDNKLSSMAEYDLGNIKIELEDIGDIELNDLFDHSFGELSEYNYDSQDGQSTEDFSGKNKEIDPDDIFGKEDTIECPKCHFEFLK